MQISRIAGAVGALLTVASLCAPPAEAQTLTKTLISGAVPTVAYVTSPPGDTARLFVMQLNGQIRIIKNGTLLGTPFINLGAGGLNIITTGGERGLLGMAFHPNYAGNGFFYVNYTNLQGHTVVARYTVSGNPDVANTGSGTTIIGPITQPQSNHNGGCLQFGPDGKLYIGMGDGGNANDQGTGHAAGGNAQAGTTLLGKMLRLDVDIAFPHIPGDNPFVSDPNMMDEVWHLGLRNPWRFSFDDLTGDMYIGDVGQDAREEISYAGVGQAAKNFGWRCMEGFNCTGLSGCTCNAPALTLPIHDYAHTPGCVSVTGGYVYRGCAINGLQGTYIFADYCKLKVWSFNFNGTTVSNFSDRTAELVGTGGTISSIASFGVDALGEMYMCDASGGRLYKIVTTSPIVDCNLNGVTDACDIASGTSLDLNSDGIPDECACSPAPFAYCTAKLNSMLCLPAVSSTGTPKVGNPFPFNVKASQELNNMVGILFYGLNQANVPFQGGTLCVGPQVTRTPGQSAGGNPGFGTDCSGIYSFDFNAYVASGADPALVAGQQVNAQYWGRDLNDSSGFGSSLSNALQFVLCN
jgi:glucose/arabinose dehydrogenase